MPNQVDNQGLVLSVDAKPRLKWTPQLHERFVDAVSQLGGVDKATPKSVMRLMGIPGLTLYHLKSHLQKYRLSKNQDSNTMHNNMNQANSRTTENGTVCTDVDQTQPLFNVSMLQMQMEVQRKLQEQIEVQKHLQLRIEAQGKYLQSVLRKAQETLARYSSNFMGAEAAKAELSELVSAVDTECLTSSFSGRRNLVPKQAQHADCSTDSCLTSSERAEAKHGKQLKLEASSSYKWSEESDEINPNGSRADKMQANDQTGGGKRCCSSIRREACVEQPASGKWLLHQMGDGFGVQEELDLNR